MKKRMFFASSIDRVASHIVGKIEGGVDGLKSVFINTAAEAEEGDKSWMEIDRTGLNEAGIKTFDYTITGKTKSDLERDLGDCEWIHVNGGNAFYLLLQMRKSGFDQFIKRQINKGVIYSGSSAGSIVAAPDIEITKCIESKDFEKELGSFEGLGLVDFITLPHWGGDDFRELYLNQKIKSAYRKGNKIILLNDDQYVEVVDGNYKIVDVTKD